MARLVQYSSSVESHGHQAAISHNRDGAQPPMQSLVLPIDHPHARPGLQKQSGSRNGGPASSHKPIEIYDEEQKRRPGLHKKTKSSVSLKSILIGDREKTKASRAKAPERDVEKKPKKSKSSTSLSAIFSRPKSSKGPKETYADYDKENQTPPRTAEPTSAPIWAQYATQLPDLVRDANKVPLNDSYEITQEISLYTPKNYSPSKQRNFQDYSTPTLMQRGETNLRPKSDLLPSSPLANTFAGTLSRFRKRSAEIARDQESSSRPATRGSSRRSSLEIALSIVRRPSQDKKREKIAAPQAPTSKRSSRVMAAVAALQGKNQDTVQTPEIQRPPPSPIMDAQAVDDALEKLLEARDIPPVVRERMRTCDVQVKASFVRSESTVFSPSPLDKPSPDNTEMALRKLTAKSATSRQEEAFRGRSDAQNTEEKQEEPRKTRSRSRTFTFSKDRSPSKKRKADRPSGHSRMKSTDTTASTRSISSSLTAIGRASKLLTPRDFIGYLRKEQQPQFIEIGKLHKLRQVLRNETVAWVDEFIDEGGMGEVLGLLYRTVDIEWREEHEDSLLHENLLCLKALFTTSSALEQLEKIQKKLFPTLLHLLFDEERKGPSEFSTRSIIVSLLLTYLTSSPKSSLPQRAHILLSYLRDPSKPEEKQPPNFIATIYHSRPYRVWNNEILNVTKEVFWVFMHHCNILPSPPQSEHHSATCFAETHFPKERPPVAAAPYIGGVEWDATSYLATHLDLLNAIIASLPTPEGRNTLRRELRDSGFEKCMGGQLRVCKEKFYGHVHAGLITWIGAASEDGWPFEDVRQGPPREEKKGVSPRKGASPKKKKEKEKEEQIAGDKAPVLEMPKLDLGVGVGVGNKDEDAWL